ncbi:MAG: autotransporter domain-containing protein [Magnetococcales bacterium]|nr:autotransporter domain-containing protein [Magnetococcales bacterium]
MVSSNDQLRLFTFCLLVVMAGITDKTIAATTVISSGAITSSASTSAISGNVSLTAGAGGAGGVVGTAVGGAGGAGGAITVSSFSGTSTGAVTATSGAGSAGGITNAGAGGAITALDTTGLISAGTSFTSGAGVVSGAGGTNATPDLGGVAGAAGAISTAGAAGGARSGVLVVSNPIQTTASSTLSASTNNTVQLGSSNSNPVQISATTSGYVPVGTTVTVIDGSSSGAIVDKNSNPITTSSGATDSVTVSDTSTLVDWEPVYDTTNYDLTLVAKVKNRDDIASAVGTTSNGGAALGTLYSMFASDSTNSNILINASDDQLVTLSKELQTNSGTVAKISSASNRAFNSVIGGRQQNLLRTSGIYDGFNPTTQALLTTGISSGDSPTPTGVWIEGFGSSISQSDDDAYDATVMGISLGGDFQYKEDIQLGVTLGYSSTDVDVEESGNREVTQNSIQAGIYGTKYYEKYYVDGLASITFSSNDVSREVSLFADTASAEYDSMAYTLKIGVGKPMTVKKRNMIPHLHILWSRVSADSYTETGSVSNMKVDSDNQDILELGGMLYTSWERSTKKLELIPELRVGATWNIINEASDTTSTGTTGTITSYTTQNEKPAALGLLLGGGLGMQSKSGTYSLTLSYDVNLKSSYTAHSGSMKFRYEF